MNETPQQESNKNGVSHALGWLGKTRRKCILGYITLFGKWRIQLGERKHMNSNYQMVKYKKKLKFIFLIKKIKE